MIRPELRFVINYNYREKYTKDNNVLEKSPVRFLNERLEGCGAFPSFIQNRQGSLQKLKPKC